MPYPLKLSKSPLAMDSEIMSSTILSMAFLVMFFLVLCLSSMTSLVSTLQSMRSDDVAPMRLGKGFVRGNAALLNQAMRQRREGVVPDERFRDVLYADFMQDPVARLEALYERALAMRQAAPPAAP